MGVRLIIKNKDPGAEQQDTETRDFDKELITIGRHSINDIQVAHAGASRQHCKIVYEEGHYFLVDPGSANGTMLNGRKIPMKRNQLLKDNDLISVESYEIRFKTMERVAVKGPGENTDEVALRVVREVLGSLQAKTNPSLEVISGTHKGKIIEFFKDVQQIVIGRSETCDLVINESLISRRNTKIRRDWSGIMVFDMNSKNGTQVNGRKITEHLLKDGEKITVGETILIFHNPKEAFARDLSVHEPQPAHNKSMEPSSEPPRQPSAPLRAPSLSQPLPSNSRSQATSQSAPMQNKAPADELRGNEFASISILSTLTPKDYVLFAFLFAIIIGCLIILLYVFK